MRTISFTLTIAVAFFFLNIHAATAYSNYNAGFSSSSNTELLENSSSTTSDITNSEANESDYLEISGTTPSTTIFGRFRYCIHDRDTLRNASVGGSWYCSDTTKATISRITGILDCIATGKDTVYYVMGTDSTMVEININGAPTTPLPITGPSELCIASVGTLSSATTGGIWSSSNAAVLSVNSTGHISAISEGTAIISYTVSNSCASTSTTQNVNVVRVTLIGAVTGSDEVCVGATATFANATAGGVWSVSDATKATVGSTGVVTGISAGTIELGYTLYSACGTLYGRKAVEITDVPAIDIISGAGTICNGASSTVTCTTAGGVWSASAPHICSVDMTGNIYANAVGSADVVYSLSNSCGTNTQHASVTVLPNPSTLGLISGLSSVCQAATITLSNDMAGGIWASDDALIADVDADGNVTGNAPGATGISYTVSNACGSNTVSFSVTVNELPAMPAAITGVASICAGATATFENSILGGTWDISDASIASIASDGTLTAITSGSVLVSYSISNVCGTNTATSSLVVNPLPAIPTSITGAGHVCVGSSTTLTDAISGGSWTVDNPSIATTTIDGVLRGVSAGTAIVSYSVSNSCGVNIVNTTVTVDPVLLITAVYGADTICAGDTTILHDTTSGGTWSVDNDHIATIDAFGNFVALASGVVNVTYSIVGACGSGSAAHTVYINSVPELDPILGADAFCAGTTSSYISTLTTGAWRSSNTAVLSIDAAGIATAVSAGTVNISFVARNSCGVSRVSKTLTINDVPATPGAIDGVTSLCEATTSLLTNTVAGGTWSSSDELILSVGSDGTINGVAAGLATIYYTISNDCGINSVSSTINVNPMPAMPDLIGGATSVCAGGSATVTNTVSGGIWSITDVSIATIDATGTISAFIAGDETIVYTVTNDCGSNSTSTLFPINPLPATPSAISGATHLCPSTMTTLTTASTDGTWSTSNASIANVNSMGEVNGVSVGNVTISYTVMNTCGSTSATFDMNVDPVLLIGAIDGADEICEATTSTYSNITASGTWSVSNPTVATIDASGNLTGLTGGSVTVSYYVSTSCGVGLSVKNVTVNALPAVATISGGDVVCQSSSSIFSNDVPDGTWSSSNIAVATIDATGICTGVATGFARLTYTVTNGCGSISDVKRIEVHAAPAMPSSIIGVASVCEGSSVTLEDLTAGGEWSSVDPLIADVLVDGTVSGFAAGLTTISYSMTNDCGTSAAEVLFEVLPLPMTPSAISGASNACIGTSTTLSNDIAGGDWTSSNASIASIATDGTVTTVASGSVVLSYSLSNSCGSNSVAIDFTVNPLPTAPAAISGAATICTGVSTTYTNSTTGGNWVSSNSAIASVSSAGVVTGRTAGSVVVSYLVSNSCGTNAAIKNLTVNPSANAGVISGPAQLCFSSRGTYTSTVSGGTWSVVPSSAGTITSSGVYTPRLNRAFTIKYTVTTACGTAVASFDATTVSPLSVADYGALNVCVGGTTTFTGSITGGVWSSGSPSIATINAATGVATGVAVGVSRISYSVTNACGTYVGSRNLSVSSTAPNAGILTGPSTISVGNTATITETRGSVTGVWTTSNAAVVSFGTISPSTNTVAPINGVSAGTAVITYTVTNACGSNSVTKTISVSAHRDANEIETTQAPFSMQLYPNPATDVINIEVSELSADMNVIVTDMAGRVVANQKVEDVKTSLDVSGFTGGVYVVAIQSNGQVYTQKVVIK